MTNDLLAGLLHLDAAPQDDDDIEERATPQAAKLDNEALEEEEEEEEGKQRPGARTQWSLWFHESACVKKNRLKLKITAF